MTPTRDLKPSWAQRVYRHAVRALLERAGMTQKDLVKRANLGSEGYFSTTLRRSNEDCGVSMGYFFTVCEGAGYPPHQALAWGEERALEELEREQLEQRRQLLDEEEPLLREILMRVDRLRDPKLRQQLLEYLSAKYTAEAV